MMPFPSDNDGTQAYCEDLDPEALDTLAVQTSLREHVASYRAQQAKLRKVLLAAARTLDPTRARKLFAEALGDFPELATDPEVMSEATRHRVEVSWQQGEMALRGLREIASAYAPNAPPLHGVAAVARFVWNIDHTLRMLFDAFAALRRAHEEVTGADPAKRLEAAELLLDWRHDHPQRRRAIEQEVLGIAALHGRMVTEVRRGLRWLLAELHPDAIEATCRREGRLFASVRFKELWSAYARTFDRVCKGKEAASWPFFKASLALSRASSREK